MEIYNTEKIKAGQIFTIFDLFHAGHIKMLGEDRKTTIFYFNNRKVNIVKNY